MATYEYRGREYPIGSWTDWEPERGEGECFDPNLQCKYMVDIHGWQHNLLATADEPDPDRNHVHVKFRTGRKGIERSELVACSIVNDGVREHSRRAMIANINQVAGLSIPWQ